MDRMWVGYWVGGLGMGINMLITALLTTNHKVSLPMVMFTWAAITPFGIKIAKWVAPTSDPR